VYFAAPHFMADNCWNMKHQTEGVGAARSMIWYQLQTTLQAGERMHGTTEFAPVDWIYSFQHISRTTQFNPSVTNPLLYFQNQIKLYQIGDNGEGLKGNNHWSRPAGLILRHAHPRIAFMIDQANRDGYPQTSPTGYPFSGSRPGGEAAAEKLMSQLNTYSPGLRAQLTTALLNSFVDIVSQYQESDWARCGNGVAYPVQCIPDKDAVVKMPNLATDLLESRPMDSFAYVLSESKRIGVESAAIERLRTWCKIMWPKGNWDQF
jgi:hypothetical protein